MTFPLLTQQRENMKKETRKTRAIIAATATVVHHRGRALMSKGSTLQFIVIIGLGYLVVLFVRIQSSSGIEQIQVGNADGSNLMPTSPSAIVIPQQNENNSDIHQSNAVAAPKPKVILYWTGFYPSKDFMFGFGRKPFINVGCKINNCVTTADRTKLNESDALIFHFHRYNYNVSDMPPFRLPHQRYIFYLYEALAHDLEMPFSFSVFANRTANFFNWTMSHRRDSDVYSAMTYGVIQRKKTSPIGDRLPPKLPKGVRPEAPSKLMDPFATAKERLQMKTKLVAWFCSHKDTHGKRQEYFTELSKHIQVDIYGHCGNLSCQPSMSQECNNLLDTYKFYVSAENSMCPDYVTEKLHRALGRDVVPIVYGGADYSQYTPPHSIINVADFKSPRDLANYLKVLDENDALYVRHFEWKRDWELKGFPRDGWCDLCEKLNDPTEPVKIYSDLSKWWFNDVPCLKGEEYLKSLLLY